MRKLFKSILLVTIGASLLASCNHTNDNPTNSNEPTVGNTYLIENGFSNYYIVNSTNPLSNESYAASELTYFLGLATDCSFSIISDANVKDNYKYISIGDTAMFREQFKGMDFSEVEKTKSGYFISTVNDNIYIYSSSQYFGYGCLYGVYDLLEKLIGYKYYSYDEIYYEEKASIKILNYNNVFVYPSFDGRTLSNGYLLYDKTYSKRLRQLNHNIEELWCKKIMGHNLVKYYLSPIEVNPDTGNTYLEDCPNWFGGRINYNGDSGYLDNRLCYCSDEEGSPHKGLIDHVATKLFSYIKGAPNAKYFMFGQEDNDDTGCECELCQKARKEWAGNTAGLQIAWMNQVIEKVEAMIAADPEEAGREVTYVIYAYRATKKAPIKSEKDSNGKSVAYSDRVIPNSKIQFMLGDTETNYTQPLTSPANESVYKRLLEWRDFAPGQIILYNYDCNFYEYFMNFPNFSTVSSFYKTCEELGIDYMFFNGSDAYTPCFYKMRNYCEASLLWNADLNYDDLAEDFCKHFYKDAFEDIFEYYCTLRDYYSYLMTKNPTFGIYVDINYTDKWYFPKEFVDKLADYVYSALDKIAYIEETDPEQYIELKDRIYDEYLTVIYMRIKLYKSYYTASQIQEMKEIWEYCINKFGYTKNSESAADGSLDIFN